MKTSKTGCCPDSEAIAPIQPSPGKEEKLAVLAKALGHPARIRILRILVSESVCIAGDLQSEVGLAASTVSQHLKSLKKAQWVKGEVDGAHRCYCINKNTLKDFHELIGDLL